MLIVKNSLKKLNAIFGFELIQKSIKICWFWIQTRIKSKKKNNISQCRSPSHRLVYRRDYRGFRSRCVSLVDYQRGPLPRRREDFNRNDSVM